MSTSTGPTTPMMPPLPPEVDQALALLIRAVVIDTESSVLYNTRTNTSFDAEYTLRNILQKYVHTSITCPMCNEPEYNCNCARPG